MVTNNLFDEINSTVKAVKTIAQNSGGKKYSYDEITQLVTIDQWKHIIVLMKILQASKNISGTSNISKFTINFCRRAFYRYAYDNEPELVNKFEKCFDIALSQIGKITPPIVHLAEIIMIFCNTTFANYNQLFHKMSIDEHFYDNYEPCKSVNFDNIINCLSRNKVDLLIKKLISAQNGLILLDNALITSTIVNDYDCYVSSKINVQVVSEIQKRLISYAKTKNSNVCHVVKQYSELYNNISSTIVYDPNYKSPTAKRPLTLLEQTIINNVLDYNNPLHEIIFSYPESMRIPAIVSIGFGAKNNIVEQISNVIEKNSNIIKQYYADVESKNYPIVLNYGKYLTTTGLSNKYVDQRKNDTIITINKNNQLEAATKYLILLTLDKELNQIFDPVTAAKIFITSINKLEILIGRYYNRLLNVNLSLYENDVIAEDESYDGRMDWNSIESKARPYTDNLLGAINLTNTPKCTIKNYPPLVRLAVECYYEQITYNLSKLEATITDTFRSTYKKTMFGNVTVETFEQELKKIMKQLIIIVTGSTNNASNNADKMVKEWEYYSIFEYSSKFIYVAKAINELNY